MHEIDLKLRINGELHDVRVPPGRSLLDVLRTDIGLMGTKTNCLEAECGVCTVLVDGKSVNSCTMLAAQCRDKDILTIEGLEQDGQLHPIQAAFVAHGAVQCGYCIPGMILSAKAFLDENPLPDEAAIREALSGTLCRCTGYQKIVDAVYAASRQLSQQGG